MDNKLKLDDDFSGCEIRTAKVSIPYVTVDTPEDQQISAWFNNKRFKVSKRYFARRDDGTPLETDNAELPLDEWDKCKAHKET